MERPPLSLDRLTLLPGGRVHYQGARYDPGLGRDHHPLSAIEFLALIVPHVTLRYEVTIRTYSAIATSWRKRLGWIQTRCGTDSRVPPGVRGQPARTPPAPSRKIAVAVLPGDEDSALARVRRRNWAHLIRKGWIHDPELCTQCGKSLRVIAPLASAPQNAVICRIFQCRGECNPPALRPSARPPPVLGIATAAGAREVEYKVEYDPRPSE